MKRFSAFIKKQVVVLDLDERIAPDDNFRDFFYDYYTLEDMAKHIARNIAIFGRDDFVEGVGKEGEYNPELKTGGFRVVFMDYGGKKI